MSSDKPPSLPMPNSGGIGGASSHSSSAKKSPTQSSTPTPALQPAHVLPHPSQPYGQPQHPANHSPYSYQHDQGGYMGGQSQHTYEMDPYQQHHLSQAQPHTPVSATAYSPNPHVMQPSYASHPAHPPFFRFPNGVSSPSQPSVTGPMGSQMGGQLLPLPGSTLTPAPSPLSAVHPGPQTSPGSGKNGYRDQDRPFDTTGQRAPPGAKPQVTAMLWEDEGSLCFQVEANGVCVARREDNHMINGTKLLNVAGMTRGRRDGILKSEKQRHVVKIGPMHLKGVWIPFERALDFANKEKITEMLYPLFVNNISALMYHPMNTVRTNAILQAVERKRMEASTHYQQTQAAQRRNPNELVLPSSQAPHHMGQISPYGMPHMGMSQPPQPGALVRPEMGRSLTFPAPPTEGSYWNGSSMNSGQALAIDTVVNSRSMPATPASTPPANSLIQYPQQTYSDSRSSNIYGATTPQQNMSMTRFGGPLPQPNSYMSQREGSSMGPPASAGAENSRPSSRQNSGDVKEDDGHQSHYDQDRKDDGYSSQAANGYDHPDRNNYYAEVNGASNGAQTNSPPQSNYEATNGANGTSQQYATYMTSPRGTTEQSIPRQPPFGMLNGDRGERETGDGYGSNLPTINTSYTSSNGLPSAKRIRELDDDEDDERPSSRGEDREEGGSKRRKTISSQQTASPPIGVSRSRSQLAAGGARSGSRR